MEKDTTTRRYQDINGYPKVLGRSMIIISRIPPHPQEVEHTKLKDERQKVFEGERPY